jgi:hypothetical protein
MGVDLKLLPLYAKSNIGFNFALTMLELDRRYQLFEQIEKIPTVTLEGTFSTYLARIPDGSWQGENAFGVVKEDAYGNKIQFVQAGQLADIMGKWYSELKEEWSQYDFHNKAAIAYLKCLPKDHLIGLYWH